MKTTTTTTATQRLNDLLRAIEENPLYDDDFETTMNEVGYFPSYFNTVITSSMTIKILRTKDLETKELQNRIQELDWSRRINHQAMTGAINVINKIAESYGKAPVFVTAGRELSGDSKEDRDYAALISFEIAVNFYLTETLKKKVIINPATFEELDEILYKMEQEGITFLEKYVKEGRSGT